LLVAPPGEQAELQGAVRDALAPFQDAGPGTVVNVSAHRTTIDVRGPLARDLLAKGCSLDLHPSVLTPDRCAQVLLARAPVLLLPHADGAGLRLLVRSSFAGYVADWLLDACVEYGIS
jgi:sarcosine oxidase subunit gamma